MKVYTEGGRYAKGGRIVLLDYLHHMVQRGHTRQVVFTAEQDYQRYITDLRELKDVFGVKVYAYCLMTSHAHLLLSHFCHKPFFG